MGSIKDAIAAGINSAKEGISLGVNSLVSNSSTRADEYSDTPELRYIITDRNTDKSDSEKDVKDNTNNE